MSCDQAVFVIGAGHAGRRVRQMLVHPLRDMLHAAPALAARFPAVIDFPGYTPAQLTAIAGPGRGSRTHPHP